MANKTRFRPCLAWPRWCVAATCLLCACATIKPELPDEPAISDAVPEETEYRPASGLRVLVQEDRNDDLVYYQATYQVGSAQDPAGMEGLAHLVEHLWFRSKPFPGQKLHELLTQMGASWNASTNHEWTQYYATAPKDSLSALMRLEAWRLTKALDGVTEEEFAIEREVVRNELRQRLETTTSNKEFDLMNAALFPPGHALHRPVVGTHESLMRTTLEAARAFVRKHYRPETLSIFVAGNVDRASVKERLMEWPEVLVAGVPGQSNNRVFPADQPPVDPPPPALTQTVVHKGAVPQTQVLLAWSLPGAYRKDDLIRRRAVGFVSGGVGMDVDTDLEDTRGKDVQSVYAYEIPMMNSSVLVVRATLRPGANVDAAREKVLDAAVQPRSDWVSRAGTVSSNMGTITSLLYRNSDLLARAPVSAEFYAATGQGKYMGHRFAETQKSQGIEAIEFLSKWVTRERAVTVVIEPEAGGKIAASMARAAGDGHFGDTLLDADQLAAVGPQQILTLTRSRPHFEKIPRFELPNGVTVFARPYGVAPTAQFELRMRGGETTMSPFGLASFASAFSMVPCNSSGGLRRVLGYSGGGVSDTTNSKMAQVFSGNLANAVAVVSESATCSEIHVMEPRKMLDSMANRRAIRRQRPEPIARERLLQELYPNHPYGVVDPDPEIWRNVTKAQASSALERLLDPKGAVAMAVGQVNPDEVKTLTEKYLSKWSTREFTKDRLRPLMTSVAPLPPPPAERKVFVFDRPSATQATVFVGCRLSDAEAKTIADRELYRDILNKMLSTLREQRGATYGFGGSLRTFGPGTVDLILNGSIETGAAALAVKDILDTVAKAGSGDIDNALFLTRRWDLARRYTTRFARAGAISETVLDTLEHGWPLETWNDYPRRLAFLKPSDVAAVGKPCVGKEIVVMVGDAAVLKPALAKQGLAVQP